MKKKLIKLGKQNAYYLYLHPEELTARMLIIPTTRMLIKTISCLDKKDKNPTPPEPQSSSSNTKEGEEKEEEKQPQYKPKQKKKKKKKNY